MNPDYKRKWVKALRSGKFCQGRMELRSHPPRGNPEFCCLGVLRECGPESQRSTRHAQGLQLLSQEQLKLYGLTYEIQCGLAEMNDNGEVPFEVIAGVINEAL